MGRHKGCTPWNKGKKVGNQLLGKHWKLSPEIRVKHIGLHIGEKNGRWITDRSQVKIQDQRNNPEYKQWRLQVYARDQYKCKINNNDCKGRIIAHHILNWAFYSELRYELNNGITLCQSHHPLKRLEESKLAPIFKELIKTQ